MLSLDATYKRLLLSNYNIDSELRFSKYEIEGGIVYIDLNWR